MSERHSAQTEDETRGIAMDLARVVHAGDVIALYGDLGAGKTRFVRGLAEGLGIDASHVSSPTFVLMQEYGGGEGGLTLLHVDAYRLSGAEEFEDLGLGDLAAQNAALAVEWAERVESALPARSIRVNIEHTGDATREIRIERGAGESGE